MRWKISLFKKDNFTEYVFRPFIPPSHSAKFLLHPRKIGWTQEERVGPSRNIVEMCRLQ